MKPKTSAGLIILLLFLVLIPPVSGNGWPEEQTRHIIEHPADTGTDGDMFVTETGLGHSGNLVTVLDPNMGIYGYLFFKDIKLNSYFHLENATLRLHTASTMDFDNESSFTIYGISDYRYFGMGEWGYGSPAEIMIAPKTSAYVSYNSSQFYSSQWHEIDVTDIVQELKSNPWYEGPGLDYGDPGDYMAFIILGASGHDSRWFYDLSAGNDYEAQLHLHWDFSPPPPVDYEWGEFNESYRGYNIWELPAFNISQFELDWTDVNITALTETDSGNDITVVSDTEAIITSMSGEVTGALFNDTGAGADYQTGLFRALINMTNVDDTGAIEWSYPHAVFGIGSNAGLNMHPFGDGLDGDGIYLLVRIHYDNDGRFAYWSVSRDEGNVEFITGALTDWYYVPQEHYIIWWYNANSHYVHLEIYSDPAMTPEFLIHSSNGEYTANIPDEALRYPMITTSAYATTGMDGWVSYTYNNNLTTPPSTYIVTFPNGTVIETGITDVEDAQSYIDDELYGGPDIEDPSPPGEEWDEGPGGETGAFTRFRMRLWFLIIGLGCFFGPILFFAWRRPSGYYLLCGALVMLIGIGLLLSITQV